MEALLEVLYAFLCTSLVYIHLFYAFSEVRS
jgi:hypothetical protein